MLQFKYQSINMEIMEIIQLEVDLDMGWLRFNFFLINRLDFGPFKHGTNFLFFSSFFHFFVLGLLLARQTKSQSLAFQLNSRFWEWCFFDYSQIASKEGLFSRKSKIFSLTWKPLTLTISMDGGSRKPKRAQRKEIRESNAIKAKGRKTNK